MYMKFWKSHKRSKQILGQFLMDNRLGLGYSRFYMAIVYFIRLDEKKNTIQTFYVAMLSFLESRLIHFSIKNWKVNYRKKYLLFPVIYYHTIFYFKPFFKKNIKIYQNSCRKRAYSSPYSTKYIISKNLVDGMVEKDIFSSLQDTSRGSPNFNKL